MSREFVARNGIYTPSNITGSTFYGSGAGLTNITASNITGQTKELSLSKYSYNGVVYPVIYKSDTNLSVKSVQLMSNCTDINVSISGTTYTATGLTSSGIISSGTEITINDMSVKTGYNNANAIIIFNKL